MKPNCANAKGSVRYTPTIGPNAGRIFRAAPVTRISGVPMRLVRMRQDVRWVPDEAIHAGLAAGTLLRVKC